MDVEQVQPKLEETGYGQVLKNVKQMTIGDGSVRIEGGALIISDETGTDRVIIGYLPSAF